MKVAVVSQDFQTITGKAGQARRFLIYEASQDNLTLLEKMEVPQTQPTFHDLHEDDTTPHPLDHTILITAEAGQGFSERLLRRGIEVYITSETEPLTAVKKLLNGTIPTVAPNVHKENETC